MLRFEQVMSARSKAEVLEARLALYSKKAADFLRRHLGVVVAARSDAELQNLAKAAYPAAVARGFRSEAELLTYLIPVVLLGLHFETDPQYGRMLAEGGWYRPDGTATERPDQPLFLAIVDQHLDATAADDADLPGRIDGFAMLFRNPRLTADASTIQHWLPFLWPARASQMDPTDLYRTALAHEAMVAPIPLPDADKLALSGLAFRLGLGCLGDPQHGWLARSLLIPTDNDDQRRQRLGEAVIQEITARQNKAIESGTKER